MSTDNRKVVRVSEDSEELIKKYAEEKGVTIGEAADALLGTAWSRISALRKHGKKMKAEGRSKKRKASAKKPPGKKRASANGAAAHA